RTVLLEHGRRGDDVALRLRHLLAVGVDDEAADARVPPRDGVALELRAQHRGEQPGADDVLPLRAEGIREDQVEQFGIALPAARDLRREAGGRPGVHDVHLALEAAGNASLALVVAWGGIR